MEADAGCVGDTWEYVVMGFLVAVWLLEMGAFIGVLSLTLRETERTKSCRGVDRSQLREATSVNSVDELSSVEEGGSEQVGEVRTEFLDKYSAIPIEYVDRSVDLALTDRR
jgi:hypothetical protein